MQLANMCQDVVQDSSMKDLQHFQGMLDMDGSNELTQQQFSAALDKNRTLHKQVGCSVRVHCMFKVQVAAQRRIQQEQHLA